MKYQEEAHGVYSLPLYSRAASRRLTAQLSARRDWVGSLVRQQVGPGLYQAVSMPDVRSALLLPDHLCHRLRSGFARKVQLGVGPLIRRVWGVHFGGAPETQVIKYVAGGLYRPHRDAEIDLLHRYFSVVCYLNDDFRGGQTSFPSLGYSATPESGRAIVFPSGYTHCAEPIADGEKYALVAWIHGPAPVRWA
jgi:hypothetical protein